jgi:hypothetical protein
MALAHSLMRNRKLKQALDNERRLREAAERSRSIAEREVREFRDKLNEANAAFFEYRQHDRHRAYIQRLQKRIKEFEAGYEDARLDDSRARTEALVEITRVLKEDIREITDKRSEHGPAATAGGGDPDAELQARAGE